MHMVAERRDSVDGSDDVAGEIARVGGSEAHAADAGDLAHCREEFSEGTLPFRVAVGVDVLAEELDFGVAAIGHTLRFGEDYGGRAAALFAARVRDDAVSAELVAALDDGD